VYSAILSGIEHLKCNNCYFLLTVQHLPAKCLAGIAHLKCNTFRMLFVLTHSHILTCIKHVSMLKSITYVVCVMTVWTLCSL